MKEQELIQLWKQNNEQINVSFDIQMSELKKRNFNKVQKKMRILMLKRAIEGGLFLFFAVYLLKFTVNNFPVPQFVLSGGVLLLFSLVGFMGNAFQVVKLLSLDFSIPVVKLLSELEKLKMYSLQIMRLLYLSIPFYFAYIIIGFKMTINFDVYSYSSTSWQFWNFVVSVAFVPLSIWLYRKINYNTTSTWVKNLIRDNGGKQIHEAIEFLSEIEHFKKETNASDLSSSN